ncbi:TPA: IS21-like element helper ATPase IstB [Legionella pneumophila]|uniref:IS21-like element helper ATPase IstB n=1 Tax=Legionella anisa TaxID=28082 RepID=UPI00034ACAA8|nr:IS21-like element helper ATPase IstB [Legionella anisa]HAT7810510.1 AAA family ATPase [Legionella pneumophila]AWN75896.1 AAA family ATPase [Legionella anisa]AWN75919.1 AAA family ATPase [Legionella anisa]MBN5937701.1 IS21-like element helper ATPase IstB [Legionella anisa]MCW8426812.1 IS21-like element helper ATPase IstB [Legionella anisa]
MLAQPLFEQLRELHCHGMIEALQEQMQQSDIHQLSFDERFSLLVERECITRENRKLTTRLRLARLKANACIEDIDYSVSRGISRAVIKQLADCSWVGRKQNLLITGPTGTGKTWIACALANQACRTHFTARYLRLPRLFQALELARGDGSYPKLLASLEKIQLLILDDWGLTPMNDEQRRDLLEIMDDRHNQSSTIVTSQLPVKLWHEAIGDLTLGDAILDRLVHNAHRIDMKGESMRKKSTTKLENLEGKL